MNPISTNHPVIPQHTLTSNGNSKEPNRKAMPEMVESITAQAHKTPHETVAPNEQVSEDKPVKGVIHLLQEGHFKGVAAARLSINFYEEVSTQQSNLQLEDAKTSLDQLITEVSEVESSLSENATIKFSEAVDGLQITLADLAAQTENADALVEGVQSAFDTFIAATESFTEQSGLEDANEQSAVTDEVSEEDVSEEPVSDSSTSVGVASDFEAALTNFIHTIEGLKSTFGTDAIPEPNGNGVAFDRFMNIYQGMHSSGTELAMDTDDQEKSSLDESA